MNDMNQARSIIDATIEHIDVSAYTIPTDAFESDGTLEWNTTTVVVVEVEGAGEHRLGFTYAGIPTAVLIRDVRAPVVEGRDALAVNGSFESMVRAIRNLSRPGVASTAISVVDLALWDLKACLLNLPLCSLLGMVRPAVPANGNGGFTSYTSQQLADQLGGWDEQGFTMGKMEAGRDPEIDPDRVRWTRNAIGPDVRLFVDANRAYGRNLALALLDKCGEVDVTWFEEPVSSDDLAGLYLLRNRVPWAWTSPPGSTAMTTAIFSTCSTLRRWTCCKPTPPGVAASLAF